MKLDYEIYNIKKVLMFEIKNKNRSKLIQNFYKIPKKYITKEDFDFLYMNIVSFILNDTNLDILDFIKSENEELYILSYTLKEV